MYFYLSKTLDFFIHPINILGILSVLTFVLFVLNKKFARFIGVIMLGAWIGVGYVPIPTFILTYLENSVPRPSDLDISNFDCIIILGGGTGSGLIPLLRDEATLGSAAERVTKAVELSRKYKNLKILFSGFSGALFHNGLSESEVASRFFDEQGVKKSALLFDNQSRNTHENAIFAKKIMDEHDLKKPLLITSALHMPRAASTFLAVFGMGRITFYPVDYNTSGEVQWLSYSWKSGIGRWNSALRELLGIFVYTITGKF
jgi:uncharacterized SAM-binding protein YcdF (DUF218 family)